MTTLIDTALAIPMSPAEHRAAEAARTYYAVACDRCPYAEVPTACRSAATVPDRCRRMRNGRFCGGRLTEHAIAAADVPAFEAGRRAAYDGLAGTKGGRS